MADSSDTSDVVSFSTENNGTTNIEVTGYDEAGIETTAYLALTVAQMGNLAGRVVKQSLGAAIIGAQG